MGVSCIEGLRTITIILLLILLLLLLLPLLLVLLVLLLLLLLLVLVLVLLLLLLLVKVITIVSQPKLALIKICTHPPLHNMGVKVSLSRHWTMYIYMHIYSINSKPHKVPTTSQSGIYGTPHGVQHCSSISPINIHILRLQCARAESRPPVYRLDLMNYPVGKVLTKHIVPYKRDATAGSSSVVESVNMK